MSPLGGATVEYPWVAAWRNGTLLQTTSRGRRVFSVLSNIRSQIDVVLVLVV